MHSSVAVIIPLFNGACSIRSTLDSVFSQTQPPSEIIVVDDGSEDDSIEIVSEYTGLTLLRNPGKGADQARDFGFKHTSAPLLVFLDQDDIWHPDFLKTLSGILDQHTECMAVLADFHLFKDSCDLHFDPAIVDVTSFDPWDDFPVNRITTPSSVMIRREALESIGQWSTKYHASSDVYLWLRLSERQPFLLNKHKTLGYRQHDNSWSYKYRVQNVQQYFDELITLSRDVLAHRVAINPHDTEALNNRLEALISMSGILTGLLDSDARKISNSALDLERHLSNESSAYKNSMIGMFHWFLVPGLAEHTQLQKLKLLRNLIENWPAEAQQTRNMILRRIKPMLSIRAYIECIVENLFQWHHWIPLANILYSKVITRLKQS